MAERWIRTNEAEDVAGSIRHVLRSVEFAKQDALAWKWVVIALHSALQGACVCHLTTTAAPVGAVTKRNAAEWLQYLENSRSNPNLESPKTHLKCLPDLLKAVRNPHSAGGGGNSAGIAISDSELNSLCRFHKHIRNQFTHFEPMSWSIEVSGIPKIANLVARIISDILRAGWAFRHLDYPMREAMEQSLHNLEMVDWPT